MRKRSQRTSPERTEPSTNANEQIQEQTDADASGASDDVAQPSSPALPVEKKSRRPRKLTDEQLEAHGAEQQWCREVLAELARRLDVKTVPRAGQQKAAAKWLYGELAGVEDGQRRLWQCYEITKRSPFWCDKTLLLSDLLRPIPEYRRDPAGYRAAIEREIETGKRRQEAGNGSISGHRRDRIGSRQSPGRLTPEYYAAAGRRMAQRSAEAEDAREQFAKFRAGLGSSVASSG